MEFFTYGEGEYPIFFSPKHQRWVGDFTDACGKSGLPYWKVFFDG